MVTISGNFLGMSFSLLDKKNSGKMIQDEEDMEEIC
jgi:hypothetical protein